MRHIKFRAKTINEGEWLYGMTISHGTIARKRNNLYMEVSEGKWKGIYPETLGQFTGMLDKNGKEIYEGDIIRLDCHAWLDWKELDSVNAEIAYDDGAYEARWKNPDAGKPYPFQNPDDEEDVEAEYVCEFIGNLPNTIEVVGSIYDTPDLLNGK